ncbi:ubiquitin carboxyl-terminal hydrolase 5 [Patella vulgata]|uniref:ubiquitin carboxyl-terminal hydrolase 5 n=1 Tax=Patella vulgata TaxID=6465 RepID=UPI0024A7CF16|nr:ubiquitin carboxyl-terminal hydrolase 5 [Patella vulgata]
MEVIKQNISKIKSPLGGEKVYKDECAYSFDNPESENGLYICMNTFLGLGKKHVERHYRKTGNQVFLNIKRRRIEVPKDDQPPEKKPTKLAIGVEGGFQVDDKSFRFEEETSIVVLPDWTIIPLTNTDLPDMVQLSAASILTAVDAWKMEEAAAMACTWEGEKLRVSKHADNLLQLDNGKKIPPKGWKCEQCDLTSNLWLNLTDGSILCGRKFFDGSGGNNHAVEAYQQTKYPLAVKLGTITAAGGDVYSYEEDDMVEDPHLAKHLAHFGINISALEKTDKTMVELEIDLNQKIGEWDVIQESGNKLQPVYGAGLTGMRNLGNSCYMNSVMQVVFTIPDFQKRYYDKLEEIFGNAGGHIPDDLNVQM